MKDLLEYTSEGKVKPKVATIRLTKKLNDLNFIFIFYFIIIKEVNHTLNRNKISTKYMLDFLNEKAPKKG